MHSLGMVNRSCLAVAVLLSLGPWAQLRGADGADIKIVFAGDQNGNNEVYKINADGSGLVNLTNKPSQDTTPQWSPDGTKVAFRSDRDDDNDEIYVMNADGSGQTRLTDAPGPDTIPQWSPDGTRIAFGSRRDGGEYEIYVMNSDGSDQTRLTNNDVTDDRYVWSPDGTKIAFRSRVAGETELFVMNADGSGLTNLTNTPEFTEDYPRWSPDGSRILFHTDRDAGLSLEVYVINADGSAPTNLSNSIGVDAAAEWSPDGSKIVFQSSRSGVHNIYVMNSDGSGLINLTNDPINHSSTPVWSRGGSRVLYQLGNDLWVMDADGAHKTKLTNSATGFIFYDAYEDYVLLSDGGVVMATLAPKVSSISPLSIISLFGVNFTDQTILFPNLDGEGKIATTLGGACFEVNGVRTPIFAVTPKQANIQVGAEKSLGPVSVAAIRDCNTVEEVRSEEQLVTMTAATPAFFLFPPLVNDGNIAARFNADNVAVAPAGKFKDQFGTSRTAEPKDIITLYGTGWGDTEAALETGELAGGAAELLLSANVIVTFGGVVLAPEDVLYVGVTPGTAGLYQLVIRVPTNAQNGNNQVVLTVYGKSTPVGPVIPVGTFFEKL